jgi:hypothetical protein
MKDAKLSAAGAVEFNLDISRRLLPFSLTPGFSGGTDPDGGSRFNGFRHGVKAAEAAGGSFCYDSPG